MWEKFKLSLGKFIQDILNIFKKKNKTRDWDCVTFSVGAGSCDELHLGPGKITIMPLADKQITWDSPLMDFHNKIGYNGKDNETPKRGMRAELPLFEDGISEEEFKELVKNLISIYLTDLPKRHLVKTLIVSCYASFDYDSVGVDISQLEETGIAHYWCTSTKPMAAWDQELTDGDEEEHVIIKNAVLLEWPNNYWTWEIEEDES